MNSPTPEDEGAGASLPAVDSQPDQPELAEILEALPEDQRGKLIQVFEQTVMHKGWLPPPQQLAEYEAVLPGLAERIVQLPEREQAHRHAYIDSEAGRADKLKTRGQHYALISLIILLCFAGFLASIGAVTEGAALAGATIVGVVGIFVTGKILDTKAEDQSE